MKTFAEKLNNWYKADHRDLPFRHTKDPYQIWVSEVMAQQTRIESMLPYYEKWMMLWPSVEDLAKAQIEDVLHVWQGLGYYNRARKLHAGAQLICEKYNGKMPHTTEELLSIPGIGAYTAGAIMSICFNEPVPAVDGNVLRVVGRHDLIEEDVSALKTQRFVYEIVKERMEEPCIFTQALMELGARVCTPKSPACLLCPLSDTCLAYELNVQSDYPHKKPKKKPLELNVYTYVVLWDNHVLISTDDSDGLMKGLVRLPQFNDELNVQSEVLGSFQHVFSHRVWKMSVHLIEKPLDLKLCFWWPIDRLDELSMVTAHRKILKKQFGLQ